MLYNSLLLPHINYCLTTWGYQCNRLQKRQKRAIRIITLSKYNDHTAPLFKKLNLLTIKDILALQELKLYYKFIHNNLPPYIQQWQIKQNINLPIIELAMWLARRYVSHVLDRKLLERLMSPSPKSQVMFAPAFS